MTSLSTSQAESVLILVTATLAQLLFVMRSQTVSLEMKVTYESFISHVATSLAQNLANFPQLKQIIGGDVLLDEANKLIKAVEDKSKAHVDVEESKATQNQKDDAVTMKVAEDEWDLEFVDSVSHLLQQPSRDPFADLREAQKAATQEISCKSVYCGTNAEGENHLVVYFDPKNPPNEKPARIRGKLAEYLPFEPMDACDRKLDTLAGPLCVHDLVARDINTLQTENLVLVPGKDIGDGRHDQPVGGSIGHVMANKVGISAAHIFEAKQQAGTAKQEWRMFRVTSQCSELCGFVTDVDRDNDIALFLGNEKTLAPPTLFRKMRLHPGFTPEQCLQFARQVPRVYKIGRSTGLTTGEISDYRKPMPDEEWNLYGLNVERFILEGGDSHIFAAGGDSGALVFTLDAQGFVSPIGIVKGGLASQTKPGLKLLSLRVNERYHAAI